MAKEKKNKTIKTSGFFWGLGRLALWLRDHWALTICTGLAALALAFLPRYAVDDQGKLLSWALPLLTGLAMAAAVAAVLDKVADNHSKRRDALEALGQQTAGGKAMSGILAVLEEIHDGAFVDEPMRTERWVTLRTAVATAASLGSIADNVRATYYPLTWDGNNKRELKSPKSRPTGTRQDQASSVFLEATDPDHPIWGIMEGRDTACQIISYPDTNCRVAWDQKPYKTFISVPVKADNVQFGLLSLNAPVVGDLTELDRLSLIALARTIGTVLALEAGAPAMLTMRASLGAHGLPR